MNAKELCTTLEQHPLISHATDEPTAEQQRLIDAMKPREIVAINATLYSELFDKRAWVGLTLTQELLEDVAAEKFLPGFVTGMLFDGLRELEQKNTAEEKP